MRSLGSGFVLFLFACSSTPDGLEDGSTGGAGGTNSNASGGASAGGAYAGGAGGTSVGGSSGVVGVGGNAGASSAGSAGQGGSAGANSSGGSSDPGVGNWTPPTCTDGVPGAGLPETAPALTPGVWTNISPSALTFAGDPGSGSFSQGIAIDPCNPATIYVCTENFNVGPEIGLYKTTNAGASWAKVGQLDEPIRVRVDPSDSMHLYGGDGVRGSTMGFFVSTDGGATWTMPQGFKDIGSFPDNPNVVDVYDIAVDPQDFNHLLVTSHSAYGWEGTKWNKNAGVVESTDAGTSWVVHDPVDGWGAGHSIWFLNDSSTWLLGTQGDGYWRTTNSGADWTQVTTTNMAHGGGQVYFTQAGVLYSSSEKAIMRSTDNGATWSSVGGPNFTTSVYGDGTTLYTRQAYGSGASAFSSSPESDGASWTDYNGGEEKFTDGPFEMAFDAANGILYSANWGNGVLALKVQ